MKNLKIVIIFLLLIKITTAQESVVPAGACFNQLKIRDNKTADTLTLPFFVDFSLPDDFAGYFSDDYVKLNTEQAVLPPSVGVAVFDALDENNEFYNLPYGETAYADTLTSKPVDLTYSATDNVYFSFYYEGGGLLDPPEENDSLILEFYSPSDSAWYGVWSVAGSQMTEFEYVVIPVTDEKYLQKGFKFRFLNKVSLGSAAYPDLVANCDFWFVDYIYLNSGRTATDISNDIAFQYPFDIKIDDYRKIPYEHYKKHHNQNHSYYINFRNSDDAIRDVDSVYVVFEDLHDGYGNDTLYLGSYTFPPSGDFYISNENINFNYPLTSPDYLHYNLKMVLVTDTYDPVCNNVVETDKRMDVSYAYDDGTAENGYGLSGEGTLYAYVAQKFYTYEDDDLTALRVYFNETYKKDQPFYYYLVIWNNDAATGLPGEIIYEKEGFEIDHDNLNDFQTFVLDEPVPVSDTFYVGWMKTVDQIMNVGLDKNTTDKGYKFYSIINGEWKKSGVDGVLMMRPVFGNIAYLENTDDLAGNLQINIYPNPVKSVLIIELLQNSLHQNHLQIIDLSGKTIISKDFYGQKFTVNLSSLKTGLYILKIVSDTGVYTAKIIKK